ncbi:MAG: ribose 5-phosphate isomerase B [Candidatus Eremiobacteraeota bacterium]|nr:ribose 5-phosphate isomerase B [Candidatus Eremiobacteraeota bacterium]
MRVSIGADEAGFTLKTSITAHLRERGVDVHDYGVDSTEPSQRDYPDVAQALAQDIASGTEQRGILICGTGIGMAITANKIPGVRAAQTHDTYSAERAAKSNDAQIITIGARVVGSELANAIVDSYLASTYAGGNSERKVDKMKRIDDEYRRTVA